MKLIIAILFFLLTGISTATAQVVVVDITRAKLNWTWTPAPNSTPADGFIIHCGAISSVYTKHTVIANPATRVSNIQPVIGGNGNWFCNITVYVQTASGPLESEGSNEINFFAAVAPSGIITISITP